MFVELKNLKEMEMLANQLNYGRDKYRVILSFDYEPTKHQQIAIYHPKRAAGSWSYRLVRVLIK
jgi:hypothetical protein